MDVTPYPPLRHHRLPFTFDAEPLATEVAQLPATAWLPHYNPSAYEGGWSVAPLRAIEGLATHIYPDPQGGERFRDTPLLSHCPATAALLAQFACPLRAVRLMRLAAGAIIKPHRDLALAIADGEVRLHIPIVTHPAVEFVVAGQRVPMAAGECWFHDFTEEHSVANRSPQDRIHLVMDCAVNPWLLAHLGP